MKKERLKFRCWGCEREYSMTREFDGSPTLLVACPYCEKEGVVALALYPKKVTTTIYRGEKGATADAGADYIFPPVIPTAAPPKDEI